MASQPRSSPRIARVFGAVNIGSFRISAMIAGLTEGGEMVVLGSGHRAAQGIKRGYITDMAAATFAVRDAIERAEKRLEEGTYGLSVESGRPIPDERLELIPWAERTADEQARYERSV